MERILSGIRPTGGLHLGNYLGAIQNWVHMQNAHPEDENLFCVVDLHSLDTVKNPHELKDNTYEVAAALVASGIDPKKSAVFVQSHVPQHACLQWVLACQTPLGWLNRMTQFKEKAGKKREMACLGLYAYPVLQAADVLLYKATKVPIGEDQKQHIELARDIAGAFNRNHDCDFFPLPDPLILGDATRVMSLRDGASKMSKSDASEYSRIEMMDDADTVALKIRKAKTDPEPLPDSLKGLEGRLEAKNLVTLYAVLTGQSQEAVCQSFVGQNFSTFKPALTEVLVDVVVPIGDRMRTLLADKAELDNLLTQGRDVALPLADKHLKEVYELSGMLQLG